MPDQMFIPLLLLLVNLPKANATRYKDELSITVRINSARVLNIMLN